MAIEKKPHKEIINKPVVTKEGKKLGTIRDVTFETRTGELIHMVLKDITPYSNQLNLVVQFIYHTLTHSQNQHPLT